MSPSEITLSPRVSIACARNYSAYSPRLSRILACAAISILLIGKPVFAEGGSKPTTKSPSPIVSKSSILKSPKGELPTPKKSEIIRAPKAETTPIKEVEPIGNKKEPIAPILSVPSEQGGPKPSIKPLTVDILSKPKAENKDEKRKIITAPSEVKAEGESKSEIIKTPGVEN
jgi:hypothetical protein